MSILLPSEENLMSFILFGRVHTKTWQIAILSASQQIKVYFLCPFPCCTRLWVILQGPQRGWTKLGLIIYCSPMVEEKRSSFAQRKKIGHRYISIWKFAFYMAKAATYISCIIIKGLLFLNLLHLSAYPWILIWKAIFLSEIFFYIFFINIFFNPLFISHISNCYSTFF